MPETPRDYPYEGRPYRLYSALCNYCNYDCPWCSTWSSPEGKTFLSLEDFKKAIPKEGPFEVQLEGGEPLAHPEFFSFVELLQNDPRCKRIILSTNGALIPREQMRLRSWLSKFGHFFTFFGSV